MMKTFLRSLALASVVFFSGVSWAATAENGASPEPAKLFQKYCAICHGVRGDGQSSVAQGMVPPPTDFTLPGALVTLSRERMQKALVEGRPGTAMVSWASVLSEEQRAALVDYIRDTLMLSSSSQEASLGRRVFAANCSVCHGDKGDTARWAQSGLSPQPRNFTTDQSRKDLSRERMIFSVTYGRPETAMPAWGGRLPPEEIEAVVDYIRGAFLYPQGVAPPAAGEHLAHQGGQGGGHAHDHYDLAAMTQPMPNGLTGDVVRGKEFFNKNCAVCHGENGDGRGPRAFFINPKPRNFLHPSSQHKFNRAHLYEVVVNGMRGTEMPAWKTVLTPQEMANVAEYVFDTFIRPGVEKTLKEAATQGGEHAGHDHGAAPAPEVHDHGAAPAPEVHDHGAAAPAAAPEAVHDHGAAAPAAAPEAVHDHGAAAPAAAPEAVHDHGAAPAAAPEAVHDHGAAPAASVAAPIPQPEEHHGH